MAEMARVFGRNRTVSMPPNRARTMAVMATMDMSSPPCVRPIPKSAMAAVIVGGTLNCPMAKMMAVRRMVA